MEYRRLGLTGMRVSAISIGAWLTYGSDSVDFKTSEECLTAAIASGINFIDVADIYAKGKAEETVGKVIKKQDRTKLVISTKTYWPMSDDINDRGLSRKHITESVHKSLKRLGTDYIDIFFCHRYDPTTNTDETVRAIDDLIRQGKILYWGTSMWEGTQIHEAFEAAYRYNCYTPVVEQPLYNMLDRHIVEGDMAVEDVVSHYGMGLVVWSPLAGGLLTGKYSDGIPEDSRAARIDAEWAQEAFATHRIEQARGITELAKEIDTSPSALALAWAINHPNVDSAIIGATKPSHIEDNLRALDVQWTHELEMRIEEILNNRPSGSARITLNTDELPAL